MKHIRSRCSMRAKSFQRTRRRSNSEGMIWNWATSISTSSKPKRAGRFKRSGCAGKRLFHRIFEPLEARNMTLSLRHCLRSAWLLFTLLFATQMLQGNIATAQAADKNPGHLKMALVNMKCLTSDGPDAAANHANIQANLKRI